MHAAAPQVLQTQGGGLAADARAGAGRCPAGDGRQAARRAGARPGLHQGGAGGARAAGADATDHPAAAVKGRR
ncbi:hypothetical protein GCM10027168_73350 [Streptomyces capparidis]